MLNVDVDEYQHNSLTLFPSLGLQKQAPNRGKLQAGIKMIPTIRE